MKLIAINGSPRKDFNTVRLLKSALQGVEQVGGKGFLYHLYDRNYQGCSACFACKAKHSRYAGDACIMHDGLRLLLKEIASCDGLIIGSPIYLGDLTGAMKSFLERLIYPHVSYQSAYQTHFKGHINTAAIYTMGVNHAQMLEKGYGYIFENTRKYLSLLNGDSVVMTANDCLQFTDYNNYDADRYDALERKRKHEVLFSINQHRAYDLGHAMASGQLKRWNQEMGENYAIQ